MGHEPFRELVKKSWSKAVAAASSHIDHYRPELIEALESEDPEVRSAAVASLNEGNDAASHDDVIKLMKDPDSSVRHEVAEYLQDFALASDAKQILETMESNPSLLNLLSNALKHITGREDGLMDEEDPPKQTKKELSQWRVYLQEKGIIK